MNAGATKVMWLFLLRQQRRVKTAEIAVHAKVEERAARPILKSMVEYGSVVRHEPSGEEPTLYEVTNTCAIPLGVSVQEVRRLA